ncbi:uncharacterized protein LOC122833668 isoform X2 [Gambusia affinis]|uniref:uncharacterized protein LOC122833668 isoform X2 n=1 Tax=Gambusia affinis TaxID=33528 RepID=UPI001CDC1B1D|nr:uncharacterized protein LOC122833668 isoform X2 [Gambusia affinis]
MFNFGKNPESSSKQEEDKEAVFGRAFSLLKEATDLFEKKEDLIDQLRQLQKKIADMKCINDDYLYLKSQIYIYESRGIRLWSEFLLVKSRRGVGSEGRDIACQVLSRATLSFLSVITPSYFPGLIK